MKNNIFKFELEVIYKKVNDLVKQYRAEGISETQKNFILTDLLEVSNELVMNNCKRFIRKYTITDLTVEELYSTATTLSLLDTLNWFDFEKHNNFMIMWSAIMEKRFYNELVHINCNKNKFVRNKVCSADKELTENGETIQDFLGEEDFAESFCHNRTLKELLDKFEEENKYGKVIRCYLIGNKTHRSEALKKVLGVSTYDEGARQQVQRVKRKFIKMLKEQDFLDTYI